MEPWLGVGVPLVLCDGVRVVLEDAEPLRDAEPLPEPELLGVVVDVGLPLGVAQTLAVPEADGEPERVAETLGDIVPLGVPECVLDTLAVTLAVVEKLGVDTALEVPL